MEKLKKNLPLIAAVTGSVIYLSLIFNNNLWMDEAFSAVLVRGTFAEMVKKTVLDTLPPLYNLLAWAFTHVFGYSTLTLKLVSVIPMICLLFFAAFRLPSLYNKNTAAFFILAMTAAPHMLQTAVEIRMYSTCLAFTTMAAICALAFMKDATYKNGLLLTLFTVLSGYSHHYGLIALVFVWAFLLLYLIIKKQSLKTFLSCALLNCLLFIPYIILTLYQVKNASSYFSATEANMANFLSSLRYPFVTNMTFVSALLLLSLILAAVFGCRRREGYALISIYILVLCLSFLLMLLTGRTFFSGRYLIPSFGMLWLGLSISLFGSDIHLPPKPAKILTTAIIAVMVITGITDYAFAFREEYGPDPAEMLEFFDENISEDDGYIIFEDNYQIEWCLKYYEPGLQKYLPENADRIRGNIWYFEAPGYENSLDETPLKAYNKDYKGELSFDRYSFKVYLIYKQ